MKSHFVVYAILLCLVCLPFGIAAQTKTGKSSNAKTLKQKSIVHQPLEDPNQSSSVANNASEGIHPVLKARNKAAEDSIHAVVKKLLYLISGPKGYQRDWQAVEAMFAKGANLAVVGKKGLNVFPATDWWTKSDSAYKSIEFQEGELDFDVTVSGTVATVHQRYAAAVNKAPSHHGHNVYTLMQGPDKKWKISHLAWYQLPLTSPDAKH